MRDERLDFLRFAGLALIILADCSPAPAIFQLRNFDVPLMVLVAGASFGTTYRYEPYFSYVWKRIKRLLFPCWIFLSAYFLFLLIADNIGYRTTGLEPKTVLSSYLLLSGIGYEWIIRVFLLIALVAPMLYRINNRFASHARFFLVLATVYLDYEVVLWLTRPYLDSSLGKILEDSVFFLIPYGTIFAIGLRMPKLPCPIIRAMLLASLAVFSICMGTLLLNEGKLMPTQDFKYPPTVYYLSYALFASCCAWLWAEEGLRLIKKLHFIKVMEFVAQNSLWIYLWHIPFIGLYDLPSYLKYPLVFASAVNVVYFQTMLVRRFALPKIESLSVRRNINLILTG